MTESTNRHEGQTDTPPLAATAVPGQFVVEIFQWDAEGNSRPPFEPAEPVIAWRADGAPMIASTIMAGSGGLVHPDDFIEREYGDGEHGHGWQLSFAGDVPGSIA